MPGLSWRLGDDSRTWQRQFRSHADRGGHEFVGRGRVYRWNSSWVNGSRNCWYSDRGFGRIGVAAENIREHRVGGKWTRLGVVHEAGSQDLSSSWDLVAEPCQ